MLCRGNVSHKKSTEANFLVRSNPVRNFTVTYLSLQDYNQAWACWPGFIIRFAGWVDLVFVEVLGLLCWGWVAWQKKIRASLCRPPSLVLHDCLSSFHYCVGTGVQSMATGVRVWRFQQGIKKKAIQEHKETSACTLEISLKSAILCRLLFVSVEGSCHYFHL